MKVFVETLKGSSVRTRYDENTFEFKERFQIKHRYPYDYGFIIGTNKIQKDCIDCYIITEAKLKEAAVITCDVVGMIEMTEDRETDHKVIAAPEGCVIGDIERVHRDIERFIRRVFLEFPDVTIDLGRLLSKEEAESFILKNL